MADWVARTLEALTLDEKISLLAGQDVWSTVPVERVGLPSVRLSDGPNGVRGFDDQHGATSMSYPVGAAMGATFSPELVERLGTALGEEAAAHGASVLLGPTMNIPRVSNAGRNFECFSEDPLLSGTIAAAYVTGVQSRGVASCIKHVVCNDQETERFSIDAQVDERALREVYLEPFRIAIEQAGPWAAMSAYNTINGTTASEHPLLDDVLRAEYGFDGVVVSDWFGTYSERAVTAGLDLEMPGPARWMAAEHVRAALDAGTVTEDDIDRKVANILTLVERTGGPDREPSRGGLEETDEHRALAREVATASMVLLTNDGTLPLANPARLAVIGEHAARTPHQGGGSSAVKPHRSVSVLDGLEAALGEDAEVVWSRGCDTWKQPPLLDPQRLAHEGGTGLLATYFPSADLDGEPLRTEVLRKTFAGWFGEGTDTLDHEHFGLRVEGSWTPAVSGTHRLSFEALGRARVWVGGEQVLDAWEEGTGFTSMAATQEEVELSRQTVEVERDLVADEPVELVIEYGSVPGPWRHVRVGVELVSDEDPIATAVATARDADAAVVVVGLGDEWESEGHDRPDLRLPRDQDELVRAVAAVQPRTVVVIAAGAPVEVPWADDVAAIVHAWYGGQEVGHAVADVLLGRAEPSGRLPVTWPADSRQHPGLLNFPGEAGVVRYGEGIHAGYRGFDKLGLEPAFRFGHGGSYTTFSFGDVTTTPDRDGLTVHVPVRNTGERDGVEVVQVYAHGIGDVVRRLVGYARVEVGAGATTTVDVHVGADRLTHWDPGDHRWVPASGALTLEVNGVAGTATTTHHLPSQTATSTDD